MTSIPIPSGRAFYRALSQQKRLPANIDGLQDYVDPYGFLVRMEAWSEGCLSEGVGPWSSLRHGEDAQWPAGTLSARLEEYKEEARLRRKVCSRHPNDPDAPPQGYRKIGETWIRAESNAYGVEYIQVLLYRKK